MTYKIDKKDLRTVLGFAKDKMFYFNLPLYVSMEEVERGEIPSLAMLEAALMFLNSKGLLTKLVEIDYTQDHDDCDMPDLEPRKPVQ